MKKLITFITALVIALSIFACDGNADSTKTGNTKVRLNEVTHSIFYVPLYLAIELGYFADEKIDLELTNGGGADNCMTALLSGNADVIFCGPEAAIYVINGGRENYPKVFAQLTKRDGSFLVSRNAEPEFKWSDLEGKEVIAGRKGGVPAMTFEYVVNKHNLVNGSNITLNFDVQFNLMAAAFEGGTGDYVTLFEPTASEFQAAGKGHIVASVGAESGEVPYTAFIATKNYIAANRDLLTRFVTAVQRAILYLENNTSDDVAKKLTGQFPAISEQSIKTAVESYISIDAWMKNMSMTEDALDRLQTIITNAGELETKVLHSTLVDNTIAAEVYTAVMGE